jgi:F-type H+-transporting ATPase subunit a
MIHSSSLLSSGEYIQHHLDYLQLNLRNFTFSSGGGFWTLNIDTLATTIIFGAAFFCLFRFVATRLSVDKPGKLQNAIEMIIEFVQQLVKEIYHGKSTLIAPLALTIFIWIFSLNAIDLIPVDLIPKFLGYFGITHFRCVPTDDPNFTFALSFSIFFLVIFYNLKIKKLNGFAKEIITAPFGIWFFPLNITFRIIEEVVKPISLALRLFGNMFAGELIFFLIATMPWWIQWTAGGVWSIFHLLVITIQAFIFMMLSVIYLSMAHEH